MIDIHFHCLPGIDDGPLDMDEAVNLCRKAGDEGTTQIVATPHVLRESWVNEELAPRDALLAELNSRLGGSPVVLPGCEYFFSADALELWERGASSPLYGLNRTNYLLVEFPSTKLPRAAESVFHEFRFMKVTPVIAHPERNLVLAQNPEVLERLCNDGAITQITAASITGEFGKAAQTAVDEFFKLGLVHTVASDAHNLDRRPPRLRAAYERATEMWGAEAVERIFVKNAEAVVGGKQVASGK
jgi:protein-tyrosine phosphatase